MLIRNIEHNKEVVAFFLDLSAKLVGTVKVPNAVGCVCADIDQQRKELLLFTRRGELRCYAVRLVISAGRNANPISLFHIIYRIETRIPSGLRTRPRQVQCQYVPQTTLGLTSSGCILCWETCSLDLLWHIDKSRFLLPPSGLYVDRFGPTFVVHCPGRGGDGAGRLEVWSPPVTFVESSSSTFERACIPLRSPLLHLDVETIGGQGLGTGLILMQANRSVQLWLLKDRSLRQHCVLGLTGPTFGFSSAKVMARGGGRQSLGEEGALAEQVPRDSGSLGGEESSRGKLEVMTDSAPLPPSVGVPLESDECAFEVSTCMPAVGAFASSTGLPGCGVVYVAFSESDHCMVALHTPSESDKMWIDVVRKQRMMDDFREHSSEEDQTWGVQTPLGSPPQFSAQGVGKEVRLTEVETGAEEEDEEELDASSIGGYDRDNNPIDAIGLESGEIFYFAPTSMMCDLRPSAAAAPKEKDSVLQLVYPTGLVVISEPSSFSTCEPDVRRVCRSGMVPITATADAIPAKSSLDFRHVGVACRSGMMMAVTQLKEAFVFDLTAAEHRPIRLEIDIKPKAAVTCLHVADVFIGLSAEQLLKDGHRAAVEGSGITGTHVLTMVGDSDGLVNFAVCSRTVVLQQGSIRAHSAPIAAVLSTGDSMRALWKIGTKVKSSKGLQQLHPASSPGAAIITLAEDGEMKVWQPMFSQSGNAKSSHTQILSIYQLSWRISGLGTMKSPLGGAAMDVTSASLDPTCVCCLVGTADGCFAEWPIPGLLDRSGEKVQVARSPLWVDTAHAAPVTCIKLWVHLPNTSLHAVSINFKRSDTRGKKFVCVVGDPAVTSSTEEGSVAYTLADMKTFAENSTLVTSSEDRTITLWRFMVSKSHDPPEFTDDACRKIYPHCKYLTPIRCQSFTVSSPPDLSVCYPVTSPEGRGIWHISALVSGIVITVAQGSKGYLFTPREQPVIELDSSIDSPITIRSASLGSHSDGRSLISLLEGMCVVCSTHKPQKALQCASRRGVAGHEYSWDAFSDWLKESTLPESELVPPDVPDIAPEPHADVEGSDAVANADPTGKDGSKLDRHGQISPTKVVDGPTAKHSAKKGAFGADMNDGSPLRRVDVGTTLESPVAAAPSAMVTKESSNRKSVDAPKKFSAADTKTQSNHALRPQQMQSVTYNGIRMKVAVTELRALEDMVPKVNMSSLHFSL